ncbi:MAG TPA: hypothetical protein VIJ19_03375 [Opitutaceae bacterium]
MSSTVAPSVLPSHDGKRTTLTPETRLDQTRATVASLVALGAKQIVISDNSAGDWLRDRAAELHPAKVLHMDQPPVRNKGIGELWLLLGALDALEAGAPILKISGRYTVGPKTELTQGPEADVVGKASGEGLAAEISTRCYLLRDKAIAARLWGRAIDEIYAERSRIVGPRSLIRIIRNSVRPRDDSFPYSDPNTLSLEQATQRAVRHLGLRFRAVANMDVEGTLGSWTNPLIKE